MGRKSNQTLTVLMTDSYDRHRPVNNTGFHILVALDRKLCLDLCSLHRKFIMTTLKMLMCQNRSAYDRQIRIGAKEIMRKLLYKG